MPGTATTGPEAGVSARRRHPGRVVGLDLGERRIGIAVSDSGQRLAIARAVLERSGDPGLDRARIAAAVEEEGAAGVVVGLPISLDGTHGPAARLVLAEVEELRAVLGVPVTTWDERLTTTEAIRRRTGRLDPGRKHQRAGASAAGGPRRRTSARKRLVVDDEAAAILLQAFLDAGTHQDRPAGQIGPRAGDR